LRGLGLSLGVRDAAVRRLAPVADKHLVAPGADHGILAMGEGFVLLLGRGEILDLTTVADQRAIAIGAGDHGKSLLGRDGGRSWLGLDFNFKLQSGLTAFSSLRQRPI
jgi:hypothetical protein